MVLTGVGGKLRALGVRPSRNLGQNFLRDGEVADYIVRSAGIVPGDRVLEIGPGLGILTERLAKATEHLTVIELDRRLAADLSAKGVKVLQGDALEIEWPPFDRMVSNLPYQISSPVVMRLLDHDFKLAVLMFQREFAEHLVAKPGQPAYSRISVMTAWRAEAKMLRHVPKGCFHPVPKVDSAVVELRPRPSEFTVADRETFRETVRILFSHKNRKARNGIAAEHAALGLGKEEARSLAEKLPHKDRRPVTLSPAKLAEIADAIHLARSHRLSK